MIHKNVLQSIIDKYYLGENESVKWIIKDNNLNIDFSSLTKEMIGNITCTGFKLEDSELVVFNTKKLSNLLKITTGELLLELEKKRNIYTKLNIADANFKLTYALADPVILNQIGTVNEPDWEVNITLIEDDVVNLIKAKQAIPDVDNLKITTEKDFNGDMVCKFTFGDEKGHNNKVTHELLGEINNTNINIPFNSDIFRNILYAKRDMDTGHLYLTSKGIMKLVFKTLNTTCTYFLVRKDNNEF